MEVVFRGQTYSVKGKNGKLSGDYEATSMLEIGAKLWKSETIEGYSLPEDILADDVAIVVLAGRIFDEISYTNVTLPNVEGVDY